MKHRLLLPFETRVLEELQRIACALEEIRDELRKAEIMMGGVILTKREKKHGEEG